MHEASLIRKVVEHIVEVAEEHQAARVVRVVLKVGPLAHADSDHLVDHFYREAAGTVAETADLVIEETDELHDLSIEAIDVLVCDTGPETD